MFVHGESQRECSKLDLVQLLDNTVSIILAVHGKDNLLRSKLDSSKHDMNVANGVTVFVSGSLGVDPLLEVTFAHDTVDVDNLDSRSTLLMLSVLGDGHQCGIDLASPTGESLLIGSLYEFLRHSTFPRSEESQSSSILNARVTHMFPGVLGNVTHQILNQRDICPFGTNLD